MLRCATKSFSASLVSTSCKLQRQTLDVFIPEQLPIIPPQRFGAPKPPGVLESTCTAHDMAPFARHMGHVDAPFIWDADRRLALRARLDAVFFHLYGITNRADIRYIYSTFPIVEREEKTAHSGQYRSCDLCLAWINALAAGTPDAEIRV